MSWIESHQSLLRHKKTLAAADLLKVDRHKLIGHLHALWWWGLDNADVDGGLGRMSVQAIAMGAEWPSKDATRFVGALVDAGFLESADGGYVLHDWYAYAGKLNTKRAINRDRMKRARAEHVQRTTDARAEHVHTLPNRTEPNQPAANAASTADAELPPAVREIRDTVLNALPLKFRNDPEVWDQAELFGRDFAGQHEAVRLALEQVRREPRTLPFPGNLRRFMPVAEPPRVISKIPNPFFDGFPDAPPPPPRKAATS